MSDFARGGDDYERPTPKCIFKDCKNYVHTSKAGNELDVCKEHLSWFYETHIPRENKLDTIKKQLDKIHEYLISIEHLFKEEE